MYLQSAYYTGQPATHIQGPCEESTIVFVSLTLDLSDLHVVGASVRVNWVI